MIELIIWNGKFVINLVDGQVRIVVSPITLIVFWNMRRLEIYKLGD